MTLTVVQRSVKYTPNMCTLILMLTLVLLYIHGAFAATGYVPSRFQEEKGDIQKIQPLQQSGTLIDNPAKIYYKNKYL